MKKHGILCVLLSALVLTAMLAGCGSKAANDMAYGSDEAAAEDSAVMDGSGYSEGGISASGTEETPRSTQKKIRRLELVVETENLDTLLANVESRVSALDGDVEQKEIYRGSAYAERVYRNASLTLRVPAEKADSFVEKMGEVSNIISTAEDVKDVTLQYVATESRIAALTTEQTRLLELLAQAENMEDLLQIESRLTDVRTELEQVTSQLRVYDNLVNYATITLHISEVREYTPVKEQTFWQRIATGFSENLRNLGTGLENFLVFIITALPYLVLIALVVTAVVLPVRAGRRRKQKKNQEQSK